MGFIISVFIVGFILGVVAVGFATKKDKEKFEADLEKQFYVDLQLEVDNRAKIMCENCYYKKRFEELENEQG